MEIKVYAMLRHAIGGKSIFIDTLPKEGMRKIAVGQMLQEIYDKYPPLRSELFSNDNGELNPSIQVLINGRDIRYIKGMDTMITANDDIRLFPPVGGGL